MSESKTWVTRGFEGFSRGSMGNAGHNLYVSRAGVLQRIYQFDLNGDGYIDLVFSNDHDHGEKPRPSAIATRWAAARPYRYPPTAPGPAQSPT